MGAQKYKFFSLKFKVF